MHAIDKHQPGTHGFLAEIADAISVAGVGITSGKVSRGNSQRLAVAMRLLPGIDQTFAEKSLPSAGGTANHQREMVAIFLDHDPHQGTDERVFRAGEKL